MLPITVSPEFLQKLFAAIESNPATEIKVDLPEQYIQLVATGEKESFEINAYKKECMINGYDNIDYLLSIKDKIKEYENKR